ncbi:MAG: hypothetical protein PVSMB4_05030 [Ktedonobacterales bacterium]
MFRACGTADRRWLVHTQSAASGAGTQLCQKAGAVEHDHLHRGTQGKNPTETHRLAENCGTFCHSESRFLTLRSVALNACEV